MTEQKENHMTNNNDNNNNEDNRIELIGLIQDDEDDIELGDEDERPFPDSDDDIRALQDDVEDMEVEIARLRAELKTSNAERDEARKEICEKSGMPCAGSQRGYAKGRGWDCYKNQETK